MPLELLYLNMQGPWLDQLSMLADLWLSGLLEFFLRSLSEQVIVSLYSNL